MTDQTDIDALVKRLREDPMHEIGRSVCLIAAAALETLSARCGELETRCAEAYQAVGMLAEALDANDDENICRLQDVLAYGKTTDGKELLPFPLLTPPRLAAAVDGDAQNAAFKFRIGEPVRKPSGYAFDGIVRSAFMVSGGARYVVESEAAPGLLHIFNGSQLERRS